MGTAGKMLAGAGIGGAAGMIASKLMGGGKSGHGGGHGGGMMGMGGQGRGIMGMGGHGGGHSGGGGVMGGALGTAAALGVGGLMSVSEIISIPSKSLVYFLKLTWKLFSTQKKAGKKNKKLKYAMPLAGAAGVGLAGYGLSKGLKKGFKGHGHGSSSSSSSSSDSD